MKEEREGFRIDHIQTWTAEIGFTIQLFVAKLLQFFNGFLHYLLLFVNFPHFFIWGKAQLRSLLGRVSGVHKPTGLPYSLVNVVDQDFSVIQQFPASSSPTFERSPTKRNGNKHEDKLFPANYHFLSMSSKLSYEEPQVVQHIVSNEWNFQWHGELSSKIEFELREDERIRESLSHSTEKLIYNLIHRSVESHVSSFIYSNEKAVVVVFRGTQPNNLLDWISNFSTRTVYQSKLGRVNEGLLYTLGLHPSQIPKGQFYHKVRDAVLQQVGGGKRKEKRVYITGHSLGAALATVFTAQFIRDGHLDKIGVLCTFGAPKVGNSEFAQIIDELEPSGRVVRFVNNNDFVPRVPLRDSLTFDYTHHKGLIYIDALERKIASPSQQETTIGLVTPFLASIWKLVLGVLTDSYLRTVVRFLGLLTSHFGIGLNDHLPCEYERALRSKQRYNVDFQESNNHGGITEH